MIVDLSLKIDDFEFNFNKLRTLFNSEPEYIKTEFLSDKLINLAGFQDYVRINREKYSEFISDFSSYEIFYKNLLPNLILSKKNYNPKILSFYNQYMEAINCTDEMNRASLYIIIHGLVNNPKRYWNHIEKKIQYNEIHLYKRLLILNQFGLLNRNKFAMDLLNLLINHYGLIDVSTQDISECKADLQRDSAVA